MRYSILAEVYEELEKHSGKLKKRDVIAEMLKKTPYESLGIVVNILTGRISSLETGISTNMMVRAIAKASGSSDSAVSEAMKKMGDLGLVAEKLIESRKQKTLSVRKELTVDAVYSDIIKLPDISGQGSQERKLSLVAAMLTSADSKEAKYIVKTILGEMRIGVAEGILRDAIAKAFDVEPADVEAAWNTNPDFGKVAQIARKKGESGLKKVEIEIGSPVKMQLAEKAPSLKDAMEKFEHLVLEPKFDGMRTQIHKKGEKIFIFTRNQEDVTKQFPDLVKLCKKGIRADECIIEGETVGFDPKTKSPLPFQTLSRRIRRKYDIEEMLKKIPVRINLFDITYLDGRILNDVSTKERREMLDKIIKESDEFRLTKQLVTKDEKKAEEFYMKTLAEGHEGVMVKNLDAGYQPGRRVGYWMKVKPTMENLDLVIIGGVWGTGKRTGFLGSLILGCRDKDSFLACGMLGTGLKEKKVEETDVTLKDITKMLRPYIESEKDSIVKIRPHVVIEVAYEEIQKSPTYESGYALRFPRLIRLRTEEKPANQADTLSRIKYLYTIQKGKRKS